MKIYYAKIGGLTVEEIHKAMQLLPEERVEKIERTKQKKSQLQSVFAGLLLEYALQEHGLTGKELTFLKSEDGKPYVAEYPDFYYNLSHSKDYAALVVDEYPVGIDVEGLRVGCQKLVERFFSAEEIALLKEDWSDELFTKLWTRKESYLKATGYGMRMPLAGFSTLDDKVRLNEKMCSEMIDNQAVYYLASARVEEDYWLSVCRKNEPVIPEQSVLALENVDLKRILKKV